MPPCTSILVPTNWLSSCTLTTPATAPEPQAAEAPPVTTSTPLIRIEGMLARSLSLEKRRPSSSTRVRLTPRPRRSTGARAASTPVVWVCGDTVPRNCGRSLSAAAILVWVESCRSSGVTLTVGVGALKPGRSMREPDAVTLTLPISTTLSVVWSGLASVDWAKALGRLPAMIRAMPVDNVVLAIRRGIRFLAEGWKWNG